MFSLLCLFQLPTNYLTTFLTVVEWTGVSCETRPQSLSILYPTRPALRKIPRQGKTLLHDSAGCGGRGRARDRRQPGGEYQLKA